LSLNPYPWRHHSADYRDSRWVIDGTEVSRVLGYWRAGWYEPNPAGYDGYAPAAKQPRPPEDAPRHSADYMSSGAAYKSSGVACMSGDWKINASEANRVLALWRAGGYRIAPGSVDGYAPATFSPSSLRTSAAETLVSGVLSAGASYDPGSTVRVTNTVSFATGLLGLCIKPALPAHWSLLSASATGNPEVWNQEILWTGTLPSSPVTVVFILQTSEHTYGTQKVRAMVEVQLGNRLDPVSAELPAVELAMQAADSDGDGLPDNWERMVNGSLSLTRNGDPDDDGMSNWKECVAGTHPTNAASVLKLNSAELDNGLLRLNWQSATGRAYRVLTSAQGKGPFLPLSEELMPAVPPENGMDVPATNRTGVFSIGVEQLP
jgi:hypothetical protein